MKMLFYDLDQILARGNVWRPFIRIFKLVLRYPEGKITCILMIKLRTLPEGESYLITMFLSSF